MIQNVSRKKENNPLEIESTKLNLSEMQQSGSAIC